MKKLVYNKLDSKMMERQGVGLVIVFGSRITGVLHPKSDVDIGIVFFDSTIKRKQPVEVYGTIYEELTKKLSVKNIDIVYLEESPLSLQYKAVNDGIVLYEVSPVFFADYKENVLKKYFDFKFFENIFNQAILKTA
jgi:predicted nucleotidyltransferase